MRVLTRMVPGPIKHLARIWIQRIAFEQKLRRGTPVLVFQMGKVGSLSVQVSLSQQYAGAVVHTHRFFAEHHDAQVRRLHRWAFAQARPLNVISLTREPVGRNVSAFFQCFERETGVAYSNARFSLEELRSIFLAKYIHDLPADWFDKNILANFGIDVFARPFPTEGTCVYTRNNIRLLVVRSEIDDRAKVAAISDFLGLRGFRLENTNIGDEKEYASTYKAFKRQIKLPAEYVERMGASKYFRHFYDQATLAAARAKWCEQ